MEAATTEGIQQTIPFEKPWEEGRDYKVRWKRFEEVYETSFDASGFHKKFKGFSNKTKKVTTRGGMTLPEAESFVDFIVNGTYSYAGSIEIIKF